jgi:hypothetical protein
MTASVNYPPEKIPTMDWADRIAWAFVSEVDDCGKDDEIHEVANSLATALRKAKADGMREAAEIVLNLQPGYLPSGPISAVRSVKVKIVEAINQAASKLDPPTT